MDATVLFETLRFALKSRQMYVSTLYQSLLLQVPLLHLAGAEAMAPVLGMASPSSQARSQGASTSEAVILFVCSML